MKSQKSRDGNATAHNSRMSGASSPAQAPRTTVHAAHAPTSTPTVQRPCTPTPTPRHTPRAPSVNARAQLTLMKCADALNGGCEVTITR